jgi:hypothetical protein
MCDLRYTGMFQRSHVYARSTKCPIADLSALYTSSEMTASPTLSHETLQDSPGSNIMSSISAISPIQIVMFSLPVSGKKRPNARLITESLCHVVDPSHNR